MMAELKPCPNCGAGAEQIELIDKLYRPRGFPISPENENDRELFCKCAVCGYETAPGITGYNALSGRTTTTERARRLALERWQRQETRAAIRKRLFKDYPNQKQHEAERAELIRQGKIKPWD